MESNNLWERILNNDERALKELFDLHYKSLCSYVVQLTHNMSESEDIVQSVFVKLWTRRHLINVKTSLKAYLYRSARNAYLDKFRKTKRRDEFLESLKLEAMSHQTEHEDITIMHQKIEKLRHLVESLPERCREILLLSKQSGYKNKEIAEEMGISIKTVESQLRIAFQKIREGFENDPLFFSLVLARFILEDFPTHSDLILNKLF